VLMQLQRCGTVIFGKMFTKNFRGGTAVHNTM